MRNEGFVTTLRVVGSIVILLGLIGAAYFLEMSSKSMFGRNEISPGMVLGAALVIFYHLVLALILFGVGQALEEASRIGQAQKFATALGAGTRQASPKTTTCPNCMHISPRDLRGQFCEACGEEL